MKNMNRKHWNTFKKKKKKYQLEKFEPIVFYSKAHMLQNETQNEMTIKH